MEAEHLQKQIWKLENRLGDLEEKLRKAPTLEEFNALKQRVEDIAGKDQPAWMKPKRQPWTG